MKMIVWMAALCLLLSGCSSPTFETIGEGVHVAQTQPPVREVVLAFPEDATVLTASGTDCIYTCKDYTISLQVLPAGDTRATIVSLCGYDPDQLTVLESVSGEYKRYDWIWTAAGEAGDVLCRAAVLDDGNYHYSLCVSADAALAGSLTEQWNDLFRSFCLDQTAA